MSNKNSSSDFNLISINTEEYSQIIKTGFQSGSNIAAFGRRGSGKTEIPHEVAKSFEIDFDNGQKSKMNLIYCNLSVYERTDMGGYPDMFNVLKRDSDDSKRFVEMILPKKFKPLIEGNTPCCLFLDEVDKADPSINGPLLEITQQKQINGLPLKNLRCCIMTGNLMAEGGNRPSLPLLDRTEAYLLKANPEHWLNWAGVSGEIHPSITAFIHEKPSELIGSVESKEDYKDKSPRGWHNTSKMLFASEKFGWPRNLVMKKVQGNVGKKAGIEFQIYYEYYHSITPISKKLFNGENISNDYMTLGENLKILLAMTVCNKLSYVLDNAKGNKPPKALEYCGDFFSKTVDAEVSLIAIRSQLSQKRVQQWQIDEHPNWAKGFERLRNRAFKK